MPVAEFAVPVCTPTRLSITMRVKRDLARYHFKVQSLSIDVQSDDHNKPLYWRVRVGFTDKAAAWGEYVMLRCGWHRIPPFFDPRNAAWAGQYVYVPDGQGLYESDCKDKPKPKPETEPKRRLTAEDTAFRPKSNAPTPWDSKPRDWWNRRGQASQPAQEPQAPQKRKRTSFW